jgi:hypothetical protein
MAINLEGLQMDEFKFDVEISVPAQFSPDTGKPVYNELVRLPDTGSWSKTFDGSM